MVKRLFDWMFASFWLILTAPSILVIAILIRLDSPGPILYQPQMLGKSGKSFRLLRFRTMHIDKPTHLGTDARLTRVGRFIRNYSLDHLPTLLNLLKGDISIIGPRPMEPEIVDLKDPSWQRYFEVKPGLFNYAVLKLGRTYGPSRSSNLGLKQALELEYIQRRSLPSDLILFFRFIKAHVVSKGNIKARGKPDPAIEDKLKSP